MFPRAHHTDEGQTFVELVDLCYCHQTNDPVSYDEVL